MNDWTLLPDGMSLDVLFLKDRAGKFDFWRVTDQSGRIFASGFDAQEAIEMAWNEMFRRLNRERASRGRPVSRSRTTT